MGRHRTQFSAEASLPIGIASLCNLEPRVTPPCALVPLVEVQLRLVAKIDLHHGAFLEVEQLTFEQSSPTITLVIDIQLAFVLARRAAEI